MEHPACERRASSVTGSSKMKRAECPNGNRPSCPLFGVWLPSAASHTARLVRMLVSRRPSVKVKQKSERILKWGFCLQAEQSYVAPAKSMKERWKVTKAIRLTQAQGNV
jgi:hypothetical protein